MTGAVVLAALVGCGGGQGGRGTCGATPAGGSTGTGGSGAGAFSTGVNTGTKLTALSSAQSTELCNDYHAWADTNVIPLLCKSEGLENLHALGPDIDAGASNRPA